MRWVIGFILACLAGIAIVVGLAWALGWLSGIGSNVNIAVAAILCIVFTSALGTGLMALIFYSNRSGLDEESWRSQEEERKDGDRP